VKDMLFFGSRHEKADFLFGEELLAWDSLKNCTLITAFSRDQPEKVYVQHKLREADTALKTWEIIQNKGNIYICGDGWSMATDVQKALENLVFTFSKGSTSREEAKALIASRTHLDVWVT